MKFRLLFILIFSGFLFTAELLTAEDQRNSEKILFFENSVRPLLAKRCFSCHGKKKQHAELRLDTQKRILKGGESGPAIVPFHPEESLLIESVKRESFEMPPDEELPEEEINILSRWIKEGALWPESELAEVNSEEKFKEHWAFQPVSRPEIPMVRQISWPKNAIDYFILSKLEENHLSPSPPADNRALIRRIKHDLIGLPATFEEVTSFTNKQESDATLNLINQYLDSTHYGERWGRYWLDLARYADTKGYVFFEKPSFHNGYTYRDYVIESLNEDKPYNQFLLEQIAGDQLEGIPKKSQAGLGFITIGARFKNDIDDIMADRIDVLSRGLLGLTVGCARCHDHKYDPVSMEDYYSLYGVFRNSVMPLHLPFRSESIPEEHQAKAKEIEKAAVDLDQFLRDKYIKIMVDGEKRLGDYLKAAQSKRSGPNTVMFDVIVDGGDLIPELLLIWQRYLEDTETGQSPLFAPWNAIAELPKESFSEKAKATLDTLKKNSEAKPESVNSVILEKLSASELKSFEDVIRVYESEIKNAQKQWSELKEKQTDQKPVTLENPELEQMRLVISGSDSPLKVPYHYFRVLGLFPDRKSQEDVKKLNENLNKVRENVPVELAQMLVVNDAENIIEPRVFKRGNSARPAQKVERQYLKYFNQVYNKPYQIGSGRLELAKAIVSPDNPLTARVIVNRVWQKHFGTGLVKTVSDFGLQSTEPSHPLLLDHLASWFMDHGWSIKELHRYIMQSATYQQQSSSRPDGEKTDPDNRLLWRMNRRRQDFESMRDSLLAVTDQLDLTVGGPSVRGIMNENNKRRTIYTHIDRQNLPSIYRMFDFPPPDVSSGDRSNTSVPGQTLFLMNHPLVISCAKILSEEADSKKDASEIIDLLYKKVLARAPSDIEKQEMLAYLESLKPEEPQITFKNQWKYGYGPYELETDTLLRFTEVTHWTGSQLQGSAQLPDPRIGWVFLSPTGGHPGNDMKHAAVMRWTAPETMTVSINATLEHQKPQGNGIRARILASGKKVLGPWTLHNNSAPTDIEQITVQKGETIDFVVDINDHLGFDSFVWKPVIRLISQQDTEKKTSETEMTVWDYEKDFRAKTNVRVTNWMSLAQVLLISNEFQFID